MVPEACHTTGAVSAGKPAAQTIAGMGVGLAAGRLDSRQC